MKKYANLFWHCLVTSKMLEYLYELQGCGISFAKKWFWHSNRVKPYFGSYIWMFNVLKKQLNKRHKRKNKFPFRDMYYILCRYLFIKHIEIELILRRKTTCFKKIKNIYKQNIVIIMHICIWYKCLFVATKKCIKLLVLQRK